MIYRKHKGKQRCVEDYEGNQTKMDLQRGVVTPNMMSTKSEASARHHLSALINVIRQLIDCHEIVRFRHCSSLLWSYLPLPSYQDWTFLHVCVVDLHAQTFFHLHSYLDTRATPIAFMHHNIPASLQTPMDFQLAQALLVFFGLVDTIRAYYESNAKSQ